MQRRTSKRILYLDTARSLVMLWIAAFWHLKSSLSYIIPDSNYYEWITVTALSTFTFLSGFFLCKPVRGGADFLNFYKKRLIRFYPMFVMACIIMFLAGVTSGNTELMSLQQLLLSLTGLSCIIGPAPLTLWYMSMLMFFYIITPFINVIENLKLQVVLAVIIFGLFYLAYKILKSNTDIRICIYFPIYFLGIIIGKLNALDTILKNKKSICLLMLGAAFFALAQPIVGFIWPMKFLWAVLSLPIVLIISKIITNSYTGIIFEKISYSSMVVYLFHSQTFLLLEYLFGKFPLLLAYLVIIPALLLCSYFMQKLYDIYIVTLMSGHAATK